jgi:hypothetical protein
MLNNRLELTAERITSGELSGAWMISAWRGLQYLGVETFLYYTKREALRVARERVLSSGGLGIYSRS